VAEKRHIILVWELGGGLGHLARLQTLALPLLDLGHKVTVVSRNIENARKVFTDPDLDIRQAPLWHNQWPKNHQAISNAEILLLIGYADPNKLRNVLSQWLTLFSDLDPDLIIADYAPTALCAAKISAVPAISMGNGFEIPHKDVPVPSLQPWVKIPRTKLVSCEQRVLTNINSIFADQACRPIDAFYQLFRGDDNLLCTLKELDHFGGKHDITYRGVDEQGITGDLPDWPNSTGAKIFVYLPASHFQLVVLTQAVRKLKLPSIFYIRNLPARAKELMEGEHLTVTDTPVNLPKIAAQADLVISHGGHGTSATALLAGSRLLTLPTNLEQRLLSYRLAQQGLITTSLNNRTFKAEIAINVALGNPLVSENAGRFAEAYRARTTKDASAELMGVVSEYL